MKQFICLVFVISAMIPSCYGQEQGKFRFGFDLGYTVSDGRQGGMLALEPKYNIFGNLNIGLRIEAATLVKEIKGYGFTVEADVALNGLYALTADYYFNHHNSSFAPFIGGGFGYATLARLDTNDEDFMNNNESIEDEIDINNKPVGIFRTGFEWGKLRVAAIYNLIGDSEADNGVALANSYFGLSIGFYGGGGAWK